MKKKIIIIGGGIAGLSAGIYAQKNGFESVIFEKHSILGGNCTYWKRKGYSLNGNISYMTGVKPGEELYQVWQELNAFSDDQIYYKDILATIETKTGTLTWYRQLDKLKEHLIQLAPEDQGRISELVDDLGAMSHMKMPVKKSMETMNIFNWMVQMKQMGPALKVANKYRQITIREYVKGFKSEILQNAILSFVPEDFQAIAFFTTVANLVTGYSGKIYGGAITLTENLIRQYQSLGGITQCKTGIKEVIVKDHKAIGVELENGQKVYSDYVIAACDPDLVFNKILLGEYTNKDYNEVRSNPDAYQTHSLIQLFFGVKADLSQYPAFYIKECSEYLDANNKKSTTVAFEHFCDEDRGSGNHEKTVVKIGIPTQSFSLWKNMERSEYLAKKKELEKIYTQKLIEVFPEAEGRIEMIDVSTPVTIERYCGSYQGAYMGFSLSPKVKKQYLSNVVKGIDNFCLATQWSSLAGGLPSAVLAGKFAIQRICKSAGQQFTGVS